MGGLSQKSKFLSVQSYAALQDAVSIRVTSARALDE
jgi:hypothetical protein